jgi:hypothetical protein
VQLWAHEQPQQLQQMRYVHSALPSTDALEQRGSAGFALILAINIGSLSAVSIGNPYL